ncbi:MAG TPA: ATP synthase F1 subunit delta [Dehalococcoidia bacterium]|nr:ATP synthase F1 subunit delta [Dehalococcoidia bacterium]
MGVLCTNKRLFVLPDVIDAYKIFLNQLKGRVNAKVISSSKLTAEQEREIKSILQSRFSKDVEMDIEIDEDILGGLIIKIGSKMIDASLLSRLKSMQSMMNEV